MKPEELAGLSFNELIELVNRLELGIEQQKEHITELERKLAQNELERVPDEAVIGSSPAVSGASAIAQDGAVVEPSAPPQKSNLDIASHSFAPSPAIQERESPVKAHRRRRHRPWYRRLSLNSLILGRRISTSFVAITALAIFLALCIALFITGAVSSLGIHH